LGNLISFSAFSKDARTVPRLYLGPPCRLLLLRLLIALMFCLLCVICPKSSAFGSDAHKVITQIAESQLTEVSRPHIRHIASEFSLHELAVWPDRIRGQLAWRKSAGWHYINSKDDEPFNIKPHTQNGNILSALTYYHQRLSDPLLDRQQRMQSLAFFMHFIQDLHQPLHVGYQHDRGGNDISVQWLNEKKPRNLHWVWDTGLLMAAKKTSEQYYVLLNNISENEKRLWQDSGFIDWAMESKLLRARAYEFKRPSHGQLPILDNAYLTKNRPVIERRLIMAGVRLANELNKIFDPDTVN